MNLFPMYILIGLLSAVLTYAVVVIDDHKLRTVFLIMLLVVIGVVNHLQTIEHDVRIKAANQQIIELAKCQSEQRLCAWSTK